MFSTLGCQLGYYMHSGYNQAKLINSRKSIEKMLRSEKLNEAQKAKLRLVGEVKAFGESTLGLTKSTNYTTFIQLEEPHVTYIVQAAYAHLDGGFGRGLFQQLCHGGPRLLGPAEEVELWVTCRTSPNDDEQGP